ncbi:hypothetical protein D3C79_863030 [compost metagenome]
MAVDDHIAAGFERRQVAFFVDAALALFTEVTIGCAQQDRLVSHHFGTAVPWLARDGLQTIANLHHHDGVIIAPGIERTET